MSRLMNTRQAMTVLLSFVFLQTTLAQRIPLDAAVRTGKLANGFTYYIRQNKTPQNRAVFYLANKVGSILENDDQRGLAHFMEHMSFNGTTHFPKNELVSYLQKSGLRFGADINAYTSFDETVYQLPLPTNDPEILRNGIEIMFDWSQGATLDEAEIDKERGVVLEEKRMGKGAGERMQRQYFPVLLNNSRFAARLPIGSEEVLKNFAPETLRQFYRDWYRPNLQALIIVGDIDVDQMEKTIIAKFSKLKNPVSERPRIKYSVPLTGKNQFIALTDAELITTTAEVIIKIPGASLVTDTDYRTRIVRALYNQMLAGRYAELQRQSNSPFLSGSAGISGFIGGLDSYKVSVTAKPGELERGFKAAWRENERVRRFGFTQTEFSRAITGFENRFESALKEKDKTSSEDYVKEYLQHFLNGTAAPGIDYEYQLIKKYLSDITLEEVNAICANSVKGIDRDILIMAPEKENLPSSTIFDVWMKEVEREDLNAFKDETGSGKLLKKEPNAGIILSENKDPKMGITTLMLGNGIKVLLKPTDFQHNEVLFAAFSGGGTSLYSDAVYQSALAANIIPSHGAGNYNQTQLHKYLSGKQLNVRVALGERNQNISGVAVNNELGAALELMYAHLTEPRRDSVLFQGMMSRSRARLMNRPNDPNSIFQDTINAVMGNHSIRRAGPSLERLNEVNLDEAFKVFNERFANAGGFTFVFVGSIDIEAIKPMIKKYIASLPASKPVPKALDLNIYPTPGIIEKTVFKGTEPKATVNLVFSGPFDYNFSDNMKMEALKETLGFRLVERLREEESGVYTPSVQMNTVKLPKGRFGMEISFSCAPGNAGKLVASTLDEIDKIKTGGAMQVDLEKFRAERLRSMETSLKTNGFWLDYLSGQLENQEDVAQIEDYTKILSTISPSDVRTVARKYLNGKNYIKLMLMPENFKQ